MSLLRISATLLLLAVVVQSRAAGEEHETPVAAGGTEESRTIQQQPVTCRPGLCPHIKRLLPDAYYSHHVYRSGDDDPPPSLCGNLCTSDLECPLGKKCCPTNCGYACYESVVVAPLI